MDVAVLLSGEPMRCMIGDMATDSVIEVQVTIWWGLHGHHLGANAVNAHEQGVSTRSP